MSGVSDKARFHLERSIPDLHELERKKIFTRVRYLQAKMSTNPELIDSPGRNH